MDKTKRLGNTLAGTWYPDSAKALSSLLMRLASAVPAPPEQEAHDRIRALVVPHAGYEWSGQTAAFAWERVRGRQYERVILLAPSHRFAIRDMAVLPASGGTETPLGRVEFDLEAAELLRKSPSFAENDRIHEPEHSTQIQYPFIQSVLPGVKVLPVIVGELSSSAARKLADALRPLSGEETLLAVSSDFIHFGEDFRFTPWSRDTLKNAEKMNMAAWEIMKKHSADGLLAFDEQTHATICGINPIRVLMNLLPASAEGRLLHYATSSDRMPDPDRFVCYLAAVFAEKDRPERSKKNEALSAEDKKALLTMARSSIAFALREGRYPDPDQFKTLAPKSSLAKMGAFVTLHSPNGALRGCIGEIEPYRPLYQAVTERACDAAFRDPRFPSLHPGEFGGLRIEISALTPAVPVASWREIVPGRHGMTLEKNGRGAVFLPQVATEQGWTLEETLTHLAMKAGLPPDAWREGAVFTTFEAIVFSEDTIS